MGDLLYNGIAQDAFKNDTAIGWQTDASFKVNDAHTVRTGLYFQHDDSKSDTTSQVLPINAAGTGTYRCALDRRRQRDPGAADRERVFTG